MHFAVPWELQRCCLTAWGRRLTDAIGREQPQRNSAFAAHTSSLNPKTGLSGSVGFELVSLCHKHGLSRSAKEIYVTWSRSWGEIRYWLLSYFMIWLKIMIKKGNGNWTCLVYFTCNCLDCFGCRYTFIGEKCLHYFSILMDCLSQDFPWFLFLSKMWLFWSL